MITDKTCVTTCEIVALAGFSVQHLGRLEREGVVRRVGKNRWPLIATIKTLFGQLRDKKSGAHGCRYPRGN
jgi:hypothetical protein